MPCTHAEAVAAGMPLPICAERVDAPRYCGATACPHLTAPGSDRCHYHGAMDRLGAPPNRRGGRMALRGGYRPKAPYGAWRSVSLAVATDGLDDDEARVSELVAETITATRTPVESLGAMWFLIVHGFGVA